MGSLCHDDVIDEAETRRGVDSVNLRWGNLKAILAGDFLLAKASEIAAGLGTEVAGLLAATIGRLCEGEVNELRHAYDPARTIESYLTAIEGKTAALFATACRVGGHRRRPAPRSHRPAHRVRAALRHGVPDRRRRARRDRHRRAARQAGRPRHRRGHLQPPGAARARGARRRPRRRCSAARSTAPTSTPLGASCARTDGRRPQPSTSRAATSTTPSMPLAPLGGTPSAVALAGARHAPARRRRSLMRGLEPRRASRVSVPSSPMRAAREDALVRGLLTGIAAFRWLAWAWMAIVLVVSRDELEGGRPWLAVLLVGAALVVTAVDGLLVRHRSRAAAHHRRSSSPSWRSASRSAPATTGPSPATTRSRSGRCGRWPAC